MKFQFIHVQKDWFPITALCRVLEVLRSGYHAWISRAPCARVIENNILVVTISAVFRRSRQTYGSPRVHAKLVASGTIAGRNRIARIMHSSSLKARKKRVYKSTTDLRETNRVARNRLNRCFTTNMPNEVWVTDVKAIRTNEGLLYLAVMTDLFSRRVIGHAMSESNDTDLALHALNNAARVRGNIKGVIHHSDRGSPYGSQTYRKRLAELRMRASMSRTGDCWDNAVAESFFSTLEAELLCKNRFATQTHARHAVSEYIENFYNPQRSHSTNGYVSPITFELRWQSCQLAV